MLHGPPGQQDWLSGKTTGQSTFLEAAAAAGLGDLDDSEVQAANNKRPIPRHQSMIPKVCYYSLPCNHRYDK